MELFSEAAAKHKEPAGEIAFYAALVSAGLGDGDATFNWLEQAIAARSGSVRYLKIDPRLRIVRDDPRYVALLQRVGLEPG